MSGGHWIIEFDHAAVRDFEAVKSREERKAAFNALDKLRQLGPRLPEPHVKSLKGEPGLFELRPRQGSSKARLIYVQRADRYLVLAVAPDHAKDMAAAVAQARVRLQDRAGRVDISDELS